MTVWRTVAPLVAAAALALPSGASACPSPTASCLPHEVVDAWHEQTNPTARTICLLIWAKDCSDEHLIF